VRPCLILEARARAPAPPGQKPPIPANQAGVGFTASKKIGNAVTRNRAKRRLREAVRQLLPRLAQPGVDYVLVARAATPDVLWARLLDDLQNALISLRADLGQTGGRTGGRGGAPRKFRPAPTDAPTPPKGGTPKIAPTESD